MTETTIETNSLPIRNDILLEANSRLLESSAQVMRSNHEPLSAIAATPCVVA